LTLRILLVSVEAPPANNAEALQVGKVLQALRQQPDLVLDVVTADTIAGSPTTLEAILSTTTASHPSQVVQIRCRLPRWQRALIRVLLPWLPHRPDWWFRFSWGWRQAAAQLRHRPNLIYSRSFPLSSSLAAWHLARWCQVPWFLHLSDPWCESSLDRQRAHSRWNRHWERQCLYHAARISFTSPITLRRYQRRFPDLQDRMVLDPNTYGAADINVAPWTPSQRFRLVHTGSFTLGRWPTSLFRALQVLPADHPLFSDLEWIHAGPIDQHTEQLFASAGPWLTVLGLISPAEALTLQRTADLLLVVDYDFRAAEDAQFLASKLTDYLAVRRPVLVVTNENSASWQFVQDQRIGTAVAHQEVETISQALLHYWQAWKQRQRSCFELPLPSPNYSAERVADAIATAARSQLNP
jgi:hypothetical protein